MQYDRHPSRPWSAWLAVGLMFLGALTIVILIASGERQFNPDFLSVFILIGIFAFASVLDRTTGIVVAILAGIIAALVPGDPSFTSESIGEIALRLAYLISMSLTSYRVITLLRDRQQHVQSQLRRQQALAAEITSLHEHTMRRTTDQKVVEQQIVAASLRLSGGRHGALHMRAADGSYGHIIASPSSWDRDAAQFLPQLARLLTTESSAIQASASGKARIAVMLTSGQDVHGILQVETEARDRAEEIAAILAIFSRDAALILEHVALQQELERAAVLAERGRIARELHDGLVQSIAGLAFRLEYYRSRLGSGETEVEEGLDKTVNQIRATLRETREMIHDLRAETIPTTLRHALWDAINRVMDIGDLAVSLHLPEKEPALTTAKWETLQRVVQEALQNVTKHARADRVMIRVEQHQDLCVVEVTDNGCGIHHEQGAFPEAYAHFGIRGMQERATACGGQLEISRGDSGGTRVRLMLPIVASFPQSSP